MIGIVFVCNALMFTGLGWLPCPYSERAGIVSTELDLSHC